MPTGAPTVPPYGYVDLCGRKPADCPAPQRAANQAGDRSGYWREVFFGPPPGASTAASGQRVHFNLDLRKQLDRVNLAINRSIRPVAERGTDDSWSLPLEEGLKTGDCEDYVLEKRRALIGEGVPVDALSIAIVETRGRQAHAVLLVNTDAGEIVLDNHSPWTMSWRSTNYVWIKRQSPENQDLWIDIPRF